MTHTTDSPIPAQRPSKLPGANDPGVSNISPLAQVKRMQRAIYERSQAEDCDNRELAQLACAWERLEERKRVMVGKPAPKPVDVQPKSRAKQVSAGSKWSPARIIDVSPAPQVPATSPDPGPASGQTPQ